MFWAVGSIKVNECEDYHWWVDEDRWLFLPSVCGCSGHDGGYCLEAIEDQLMGHWCQMLSWYEKENDRDGRQWWVVGDEDGDDHHIEAKWGDLKQQGQKMIVIFLH